MLLVDAFISGDFAPAGNENITLNELFSTTYSIQPNGNVPRRIDAHGELTGKNVLLQSKSLDELAREFKMSVTSFQKALRDCYEELKKVRNKRPRPHLVTLDFKYSLSILSLQDNKILNSWNSLMISGLVQASRALPEHKDEYSSIAEKAFKFISKHLRREDGSLVRSAYVDEHGDVTKRFSSLCTSYFRLVELKLMAMLTTMPVSSRLALIYTK